MQKKPSFTEYGSVPSKIVIVTDKPIGSRIIFPIANKYFKDSEITFIHTLTIGHFDFKYPKNLKMRDFPILLEPEWKVRNVESKILKPLQMVDGELLPINASIKEVISNADEIVFACYPDRSEIFSFQILLTEYCDNATLERPQKAVWISNRTECSVKMAFESQRHTHEMWFQKSYAEAQIKKYFDFNFNVNSSAIFGLVFDHIGLDRSKFILSKFSLVVLYFIRKTVSIKNSDLFMIMHEQWKGTGKFPTGTLGSITSRHEIVHQLINMNLLLDESGYLSLSGVGERFLDHLHPDCCDLDLPFRIESWMIDYENSLPKIDKYIRTVFGKQIRYFQKRIAQNSY